MKKRTKTRTRSKACWKKEKQRKQKKWKKNKGAASEQWKNQTNKKGQTSRILLKQTSTKHTKKNENRVRRKERQKEENRSKIQSNKKE